MKNIFSFCNQKGGVGKTTSVINIGASLAQSGFKVLIIDMDSQGNATSGLGEEKPSIEFTTYQLLVDNSSPASLIRKTQYENIFLIPASQDLSAAELELVSRERREFALNEQLQKIASDYDFIFLDCPPSLSLITINSLVASNYLIIPMQCEYYALEGVSHLLNIYQMVYRNLNPHLEIGGVLMTMADFRTNLTEQVIEEVRKGFKDRVFNTVISRNVRLSEAPSFGKPAVYYDPASRGSKNYKEVAKEFVKRFTSKKYTEQETTPAEIPAEKETVPEQVPATETANGGTQ